MPSIGFDAEAHIVRLQEAVLSHDRELLEELVSERFALASGRSLGQVGRDDWIAAALQVQWERFLVSVLRLVELEAAVVVDCEVEQEMAAPPSWARDAPRRSRWLTTDIWVSEAGRWRLVHRHPELIQ